MIGLGLIGGSLALAATARGDQVVASDRDEAAGEIGLERGAIARFEPAIDGALDGADLAFVCGPVAELASLTGQVLEAAPSGCAVSDVGSTKGRLVAQVGANPRFVGGHPVCGSEARGVANARPELFDGATWFLTPVAETDPSAHRRLHTFVSSLGARPVAIDPDAHDRLVALTSHLPHALANVLVNQAGGGHIEGHDRLVALTSHLPHALANVLVNQAGAGKVDGHDPLAAVGGSFRDMTRVAGANPRIWVDIFLDNRTALLDGLRDHSRRVDDLTRALEREDAGFVARWIAEASGHRRRLLEVAYPATPEDLYRVRVHVPDRPGVLSGITQALGAEGINIEDFELHHVSADRGGTVVVTIAGHAEAERAVALLDAQGYGAIAAPAVDE